MHTASTASSSTSSLLPKPGVCTDCWVATAKGETSCLLVRSPVGTTRAQGVSRYWQTITTLSRNGHLVFVFIIQVLHNWDSRTEEHPRVEASACIPHSAFCAFCTLSNMFLTSRPFSKPVRRRASVVHPCFQCLLNPQALICCLVSHLVTLQLSSHLQYKGIVFPPEWRCLLIFLESNLILCKHLQALYHAVFSTSSLYCSHGITASYQHITRYQFSSFTEPQSCLPGPHLQRVLCETVWRVAALAVHPCTLGQRPAISGKAKIINDDNITKIYAAGFVCFVSTVSI